MKRRYLSNLLSTLSCAAFALLGVACGSVQAQEPAAPKQALHEVPFVDVSLTDNYWAPRIETNRVVSVPHNIEWCETQTKRINNFKVAGGLVDGEFSGIVYDDSDVYKIVEGFAYTLAAHPDAQLQKKADEWISYFDAAQRGDGYLMTYFILKAPNEKWKNLRGMHELYCAGHMAEAAVAYKRATQSDAFVKVSRGYLDLICKRYGPNEGQVKSVPGHEELELALVKMYQLTGERKYLDEAKFFIDIRGVADGREDGLFGEYCQDHIPVREQSEIVGHAVRAMYLYCGATDVAGYFKDAELMAAMRRIFLNVTRNKMYITGGIGSSRKNEGFEENFKLPNAEAYCETCASIGMLFWMHRMNLATGQAEYVDVMERAAYNGFMSGYSLNGDSYFYVNPLESKGDHHREPFFSCACCPSNVIRALPSIPGYFYATTDIKSDGVDDAIVVNMYGASTATIELADKNVTIQQQTRYPYDGLVFIQVKAQMKDAKAAFTPYWVKTRVPSWSGLPSGEDGYAVRRITKPQETFALDFPMPVIRMVANPNVQADLGRVALQRGPLVYCFEQTDNSKIRTDRIILAKDPEFKIRKDFVITDGKANDATKDSQARRVDMIVCKDYTGRELRAIPYCVWDNRAAGRMNVWVRQDGLAPLEDANNPLFNPDNWVEKDGQPVLYLPLYKEFLTDSTPQLGNGEFEFDGSFTGDALSTFDGTNQGTTPESSADQNVPRATWWNHLGTNEWFEYSYTKPKKVSSATVYWFDDEAVRGRCRTPESWKLTYQEPNSNQWKEVKTNDAYAVDKDKEIVVNFEEIEVAKIRIEVKLREDVSGGILRWIVK
ncbi:MAG: glycoside hydrolase family 127 protein [Planctomycetia bacterium]|nr:glycoside hydrolase family 127 protein [Planctomycetia bacterium]